MLSRMAAEDIKYLSGLGISLTPDKIVRLNSLALKVEFGAESSSLIHCPRVAWAGDVPIYEPSIQLQVWFRDFAMVWWSGQSLELALFWACNHSSAPGFFSAWNNERETRKEIEKWQRGLTCTVEQLKNALNYALNGLPEDTEKENGEGGTDAPDGCPYTDVINDALAAGLGVPVSELASYPRRIVSDMLRRWIKNHVALAGGKPSSVDSASYTRAYCAYAEYLESLKPEGEKSNG